MNKKNEDMTFDEIQLYRKEIVLRGCLSLLVILFSVIGMIWMSVSNVSEDNFNRFRWLVTVVSFSLVSVYTLPLSMKVSKVLRKHPDWIRQSALKTKVPKDWTLKRLVVIGSSVILLLFNFVILYRPLPESKKPHEIPANFEKNPAENRIPSSVPTEDNSDKVENQPSTEGGRQ